MALGVVLSILGWAENWLLHRYWGVDFVPCLSFVVPLFGILFGPWVGGMTGLLSGLVFSFFDPFIGGGYPLAVIPVAAVAGFAMGFVPAWLVKDARKLLPVLVAGIVATFLWVVGIHVAMSVVYGDWYYFWYRGLWFSVMLLLPANLVFLPFFARWLIKDKGKWWAVLGTGIGASLLWVVLAALGPSIVLGRWPWFFGTAMSALYTILPVAVILIPLLAFWLAGSVRRWGLYWREQA